MSIVVPVYNVERYLPECLDSLAGQTYSRLQIIVINDGSPDRSQEIMEAYARADDRFEIITQANAGLGAARNIGASRARGDYLLFIDSDDTLRLDAVETYLTSIRKTRSDFVVASYQRTSSAGTWAPAWWIRNAHRLDRPATTLAEHPDIQVNAVAWSKFYRREFWETNDMAFPVGMLYEDQAVSTRAYARAKHFDVLSAALTNWRQRDDGSSITQQKESVLDLQARFRAAFESLAELDGPGLEHAREVRLAQYLSNDFPLSIKASQWGDQHFWDVLRDGMQTLVLGASQDTWTRVSAQHRLAIALVTSDQRAAVTEFVGLGHGNPKKSPITVTPGAIYTDMPPRSILGLAPTDPMLRLSDQQLGLVTALRSLRWDRDDTLVVEGWAYIDNVDLTQTQTRIEAVLVGGGHELSCHVEPWVQTEVTHRSNHRYANYEASGFRASFDVSRLTTLAYRGVQWHLHVRVTTADITRSSALLGLDKFGSAGRLSALVLDQGWQVVPSYSPQTGLAVLVKKMSCWSESTSLTDRELTVRVRSSDDFVPLHLVISHPDSAVRFTTDFNRLAVDDDVHEATIHLPESEPPSIASGPGANPLRTWVVRAVSDGGVKSPISVASHLTMKELGVPAGTLPSPVRTPMGNLGVLDGTAGVDLDDVRFDDSGRLLLSGTVLGAAFGGPGFRLSSPKASTKVVVASVRGSAFEVAIDLVSTAWGLPEMPLSSGSYTLECFEDGDLQVPLVLRLDPGVVSVLPVRHRGSRVHAAGGLGPRKTFEVRVDAPLDDDERGAYRQERLQVALAARRGDGDFERGAVLFRSYFGEQAGCNPLAVHQELRRRGTGHTLYWAVRDHSVILPDGAIPVIHESREWYRLLHEAEFYMDNMHQPLYHAKPDHQVQIQTFHGYPFKEMGLSHWKSQGRDKAHILSYLARARDWDYLVSPATYGTELLCREFGFPNTVLEIGYPRNDVLVCDDAERIRTDVRARLGIEPHQKAVLYGPTFRDAMTRDDFRAAMVDFLDIERLGSELGPDYVILVRGHAFNARVRARVGSRGNVIDVTDYPWITDLCLASDVAVLDYSSLRFDYAITGKPMIFMVPDLEQYQADSRGTLFAYEPTAPGPMLQTTSEVIEAIRDLDQVSPSYADAYRAFVETYLDLDDGHATERLVDRVFVQDR